MNDRQIFDEFRAAFERWTDGPEMWEKIAQVLNERGVLTPQGETWTAQAARQFHEEHPEAGISPDKGASAPDDGPEIDESLPESEEEQGAKVLRLVHSKSEDKQPEVKDEPFTGRVFVEVQCSAKPLTDQIASFLKRELRSLKDVEISNINPKWRMVVMATTQAGLDPVAFMYIVSETLDLPKHLDKVDGIPVKLLTDAGVVYEHIVARGVRLCPQRTLQEVCRQIVATFDTDVVEPARAARRK